MNKIWDIKSFEVGGHWPLWRRGKKRMTTQNRQKSNAKQDKKIGLRTILQFPSQCDLGLK